MPDHFYYLDLRAALPDFGVSGEGVDQLFAERPLTKESDRKAVFKILRNVGQKPKDNRGIDLSHENTVRHFGALGFSLIAVGQLTRFEPLTQPEDRRLLLATLKNILVKNESKVPRGLPGPMRQAWKNKQLEKKS